MNKLNQYYALVQPPNVVVEQAHYFESRGGLTSEWGKAWEKISAIDLEDAYRIAKEIQGECCVS